MHYNTFQALMEFVKHHGRHICKDNTLTNIDVKKVDKTVTLKSVTKEEFADFEAIFRNMALSVAFKQSNREQYSNLQDNLEN